MAHPANKKTPNRGTIRTRIPAIEHLSRKQSKETGLTKSAILTINLTPCEYDAGLKLQNRLGADHRRHNAHQNDHHASQDRREPHHAERIVELHDGDLANDGA